MIITFVLKEFQVIIFFYVYIDFSCKAAKATMDGIIDTVSAQHPLLPLLDLLKAHGKLILVGAPEKPHEVPAFPLLTGKHAFNILVYIYIYIIKMLFNTSHVACSSSLEI